MGYLAEKAEALRLQLGSYDPRERRAERIAAIRAAFREVALEAARLGYLRGIEDFSNEKDSMWHAQEILAEMDMPKYEKGDEGAS